MEEIKENAAPELRVKAGKILRRTKLKVAPLEPREQVSVSSKFSFNTKPPHQAFDNLDETI